MDGTCVVLLDMSPTGVEVPAAAARAFRRWRYAGHGPDVVLRWSAGGRGSGVVGVQAWADDPGEAERICWALVDLAWDACQAAGHWPPLVVGGGESGA